MGFWSCKIQVVTNPMFFIRLVGNLKRSANINFFLSGCGLSKGVESLLGKVLVGCSRENIDGEKLLNP